MDMLSGFRTKDDTGRTETRRLALLLLASMLAAHGACTSSGGAADMAADMAAPVDQAPLICPDGLVFCAGACIDPQTSSPFCGASADCQGPHAGAACSAVQVCSAGACVSNVGGLTGLEISPGPLTPRFAPGIHTYTASLPAGVDQVRILAEAMPDARIQLNGQDLATGSVSLPVSIPPGKTVIHVDVTVPEGTSDRYTVTVSRPVSGMADMAAPADMAMPQCFIPDLGTPDLSTPDLSMSDSAPACSAEMPCSAGMVCSAGVCVSPILYLKASNTRARAYFGQVSISGDDVLAVGSYGESSMAIGINGNQGNTCAPTSLDFHGKKWS